MGRKVHSMMVEHECNRLVQLWSQQQCRHSPGQHALMNILVPLRAPAAAIKIYDTSQYITMQLQAPHHMHAATCSCQNNSLAQLTAATCCHHCCCCRSSSTATTFYSQCATFPGQHLPPALLRAARLAAYCCSASVLVSSFATLRSIAAVLMCVGLLPSWP